MISIRPRYRWGTEIPNLEIWKIKRQVIRPMYFQPPEVRQEQVNLNRHSVQKGGSVEGTQQLLVTESWGQTLFCPSWCSNFKNLWIFSVYQIIVHYQEKKKKTVAHQFFQEGSSLLQAVNRMPLVMLIRFLESLCVSQWACKPLS